MPRVDYLAIRFALGLMRMAHRFMRSNERGIVGPEIALLTLALSGGVFATALVNNGTLSADRLESIVHQSLDQVSGTMEVRGAVIVSAKGAPMQPETVQFTIGTFGQLQPIVLDPSQPGGLVISYRDPNTVATGVPYTVNFGQASNGDMSLDQGELATISIKVADIEAIAGQQVLPAGKRWTLSLDSPAGVTLEFTRTMPGTVAAVMAQP